MAGPAGGNERLEWFYLDSMGQEFGPFESGMMRDWYQQGYFPTGEDLLVRLPSWRSHVPLKTAYAEAADFFLGPPLASAGPAGAAREALAPPPPPLDYAGFPEGVPMYPPDPGLSGRYWMMQPAGPAGFPAPPAFGFPGMMQPGLLPHLPFWVPPAGPGAAPSPDLGFGAAVVPPRGPAQGRGNRYQNAGGQAGVVAPGRYFGRIKSFNAKQGFGFIECKDTFQIWGRDVFLHKAQIGDLRVGTEVTFSFETNKQGMPQARDVSTLDGVNQGISLGSAGKGFSGGRGRGAGAGQNGGKGKRKGRGPSQGADASPEGRPQGDLHPQPGSEQAGESAGLGQGA